MGLAPFGRLGKHTIDSASIPNLFEEHSFERGSVAIQPTKARVGVLKGVLKIQSFLLYEQPFLRYSPFKEILPGPNWPRAYGPYCGRKGGFSAVTQPNSIVSTWQDNTRDHVR